MTSDAAVDDMDLERYAAIAAALAQADDRAAVLSAHGLDEERWAEIDEAWQGRLSDALDAAGDGDDVPELLARFSDAWSRAREGQDVLPFERFVESTRALQRSRDVAATLAAAGVTFAAYSRASEHWARAMARDPVLAEKFRRALE